VPGSSLIIRLPFSPSENQAGHRVNIYYGRSLNTLIYYAPLAGRSASSVFQAIKELPGMRWLILQQRRQLNKLLYDIGPEMLTPHSP
jgi:hypothetical protein